MTQGKYDAYIILKYIILVLTANNYRINWRDLLITLFFLFVHIAFAKPRYKYSLFSEKYDSCNLHDLRERSRREVCVSRTPWRIRHSRSLPCGFKRIVGLLTDPFFSRPVIPNRTSGDAQENTRPPEFIIWAPLRTINKRAESVARSHENKWPKAPGNSVIRES